MIEFADEELIQVDLALTKRLAILETEMGLIADQSLPGEAERHARLSEKFDSTLSAYRKIESMQ